MKSSEKLLKQNEPSLPDEQYVSYDVKSFFPTVPVNCNINYILDERYVAKIANNLYYIVIQMPIIKLNNRKIIQIYVKFYKQIDGCTMGDPLSVLFSDIHMTKAKQQIVKTIKAKVL